MTHDSGETLRGGREIQFFYMKVRELNVSNDHI